MHFDELYVSNLCRAYDTAKIIINENDFKDTKLIVDNRLQERDFGSFTFDNKSFLQKEYGIEEYEKAVNLNSKKMKDGEEYTIFTKRIIEFFEKEIIPSLKNGNKIIIVSHKYVIELLCNIILDKPISKKFDLRLPNAEIIQATNIDSYVKHENKKVNIFLDLLIIYNHWVFLFSLLLGLILGYFNIIIETSPLSLLSILIVASVITMLRIDLENYNSYLKDKNVIVSSFLRYLLIPSILILIAQYYNLNDPLIIVVLLFISTPTAIVALTISRTIGGFILPTLAYLIFSSIFSIFPFTLVLYLFLETNIYDILYIYISIIGVSLFIPYIFVLKARKIEPIKVVKFSERYAVIAILLISIFILLASSNMETISVSNMIITFTISILLRIIAVVFARIKNINSLDTYISMIYPNIFIIIVIASFMNYMFIKEIAIAFLFPMFIMSIFDNWYSKNYRILPTDSRLYKILAVKEK